MRFIDKLRTSMNTHNSLLCIGLDIDKEKIPSFLFDTSKIPFFEFNKSIIDATKDLVCAYKLNMAFYEVLGKRGYILLEKTLRHIPQDIIVILDGKRNDIGNTARKYAQSLFETLKADAVTINPYLGSDSVSPFLSYTDNGVFILCRTSNPSAVEFQDVIVGKIPLYQLVAQKITKWNTNNNCGVVVGATYPNELAKIRAIVGENMPFLIPGIGVQGGDVKKTVKHGTNKYGDMAVINSSRGIIYSESNEEFAEAARCKAESLKNEINKYR